MPHEAKLNVNEISHLSPTEEPIIEASGEMMVKAGEELLRLQGALTIALNNASAVTDALQHSMETIEAWMMLAFRVRGAASPEARLQAANLLVEKVCAYEPPDELLGKVTR